MHPNFKKRILIKISLAVAMLLAISIGIFIFAHDIAGKAEYIMETQAQLNSRLETVKQLQLLKASFAEAQPYVEKLKKMLPTKDSLLFISRDIESVAKQHALGFAPIKFSSTTKDVAASLKAIDFQVTVQGKYEEIIEFIKETEGLPYFIKITDADMTNQDEVYNSSISGTIYFNG